MKRLLATLAITGSTALAAVGAGATPAGASSVNSGCPTGWQLAPISVLSPQQLAKLVEPDHDGLICIMYPVPVVAQSQEPFGNFFIYIDNSAP